MVTAFMLTIYALPIAALFGVLTYIAERFEKRYPPQNRRIRRI